ncbi:tetraspanin-1-like protein [Labeo rohita]|uniref:Tetraspanin n=1 Tax=Labeo rohita TaxID=84645 RepID=A0A498LPR9_LABRO|nr:tetraspanin-1-like protein [Labeo rohita]
MILSAGAPMLIAVGDIFALMGLIGFCGTLKKKSWILLVFFIVMLIIFILQIVAAVFILLPNSVKENSLSSLEAKIVKSLQDDYKEDSHIMKIWNETMNQLKCCGYKGYDDFTKSPFVNTKSNYPTQCCGKDPKTYSNPKCTKEEAGNKNVRGCVHVLLDENIPVSAPLSFLIAILEIVALYVSLKAYRCIKRLPDLPDPFGNNL